MLLQYHHQHLYMFDRYTKIPMANFLHFFELLLNALQNLYYHIEVHSNEFQKDLYHYVHE